MLDIERAQQQQKDWRRAVGLEGSKWSREAEKMAEEITEYFVALAELEENDTQINRQELAGEVIDVIIMGLNIIESLGYDAQAVFDAKLERNYEKYDPRKVELLTKYAGMTNHEALEYLKRKWNENQNE